MTEVSTAIQAPQTEQAILAALPKLPCPNCSANILEHRGFFNYCLETSSVCEHNYLMVHSGCIYVEHDEDRLDTESHECSMEAYCAECKQKLPWSVSELRQLDGIIAEQAAEIIVRLTADSQDEPEPQTGHALPASPTSESQTQKEVNTV